MADPILDFWFDFASTYSYLTAARIRPLAAKASVRVRFRPFLLGPIFKAQGWDTSPFNIYEAKGRYMWRDMERLCARYGIPFRRPSTFPRSGLLAARIVIAAKDAGWVPTFVRNVYRANFGDDQEISEPTVLAALLRDVGANPDALLADAASPDVKDHLRAQTEQAQRLGIFGAPSFIARGELFWGNDRLEQALRAARD